MPAEARRARLRAFAKVNLSLKVLHRREDGYHELRTIFQTISLADRLDIEFLPGRRTAVVLDSDADIPDNLAVRAARRVMEAARIRGEVRLSLRKRIPMGGGLGGGSSDAAAVLLALPVLAGVDLAGERLHAIAAALGSDVPFFLLGGTAAGFGRGEELYPLPSLEARRLLVVVPPVAVSTPDAYRALARPAERALTSPQRSNRMKKFHSFARVLACPDTREWPAFAENDFEAVVFRPHPLLKSLLSRLVASGARPGRMSGSGSALYGVFETSSELDRARRALEAAAPAVRTETARFVSRERYQAAWRKALAPYAAGAQWPPRAK